VSALAWSSNGSRLITGDLNGLIAVWKTDANGKLVQPAMLQFSVDSKINEIINRPVATNFKEKQVFFGFLKLKNSKRLTVLVHFNSGSFMS
jgi:WD40 repeat protein